RLYVLHAGRSWSGSWRAASSLASGIRPALGCSPFPYTPLFRSKVAAPVTSAAPAAAAPVAKGAPLAEPAAGSNPASGAPLATGADRKSTRLNSSHRTMSYAVFCLKKKTLHETLTVTPDELPGRT